ncbi:MAG: hypothetical protein NWS71_09795 [Opitutales bacterium]|jgi:hypothetical protein|nr:hypothetical protein [Opitutales bacterium]MDP4777567.1 hypothetical protein [Opitutales bacterium]MDP4884262.1 hypothetical protein [Opitutales bacterium]MDP5080131.1 hypothetical protein [Opitutales bacterium]
MRFKILALLSLAVSALVFSGCDGGRAQMEKKQANLLGIASYEPDSYVPAGTNTIAVSTDDLYDRDNVQGSKVTLFWGLITLKDY